MDNNGLMAVLFQIFPCLKSMDGDKRELQFKLITEKFDIVDYKLMGQDNKPWIKNDAGESAQNPYWWHNNPHIVDMDTEKVTCTYLIVKVNKPQMRGRRVVTLAPQYALIYRQHGASAPTMKCYENSFIETGEWGNNFNGMPDGWDRPLHPHVQANTPCLGSFENLMYKESLTNPVGYFSLVTKFYRTWNSASPYWNINEMRPLYEETQDDEGRTVRGKIILTALQHEYFRQAGIGIRYLRDYVPAMKLAGLHISKMYTPVKILTSIRGRMPDILYGYYYSYLQTRASNSEHYKDIWDDAYKVLQRIANHSFKYFDESPDNEDLVKLGSMHRAIDHHMTTKLVDIARDTWDEALEVHGAEIVEQIMAHDSAYLYDVLDSISCMEDFLFTEGMYQFWGMDEERAAEYLSVSIPYMAGADEFTEADGSMMRFWPEDVLELDKKAKYDCGKKAIKKLETKRSKILNEISTLHTNPIESAILQQEISF